MSAVPTRFLTPPDGSKPHRYVPSWSTDIRRTFAVFSRLQRMRGDAAEQQRAVEYAQMPAPLVERQRARPLTVSPWRRLVRALRVFRFNRRFL